MDPVVGFVEDSDEDYALLARVFGARFDLRRWPNGEAAIASFGERSPQLDELQAVLVDLDLPGIDGLEVISRLRGLPGGDLVLICLVSGTARPEAAKLAMEVGADAFLPKPQDLAGLRALADRVALLAGER